MSPKRLSPKRLVAQMSVAQMVCRTNVCSLYTRLRAILISVSLGVCVCVSRFRIVPKRLTFHYTFLLLYFIHYVIHYTFIHCI